MESNTLLYAVGELALLLLCICIYLLLHLRNLKQLVAKLEEKILSLRNTIATTKENAKNLIKQARGADAKEYVDFVEDQLALTRAYHQEQSPDKDIVLDLDVEVAIERQIAALRHAFLIAEKEASYASDDEQPSWDVLRLKIEQIINFYEHAFIQENIEEPLEGFDEPDDEPEDAGELIDADEFHRLQEELNNYKKRVSNLEKFKKLFFDMEGKWDAAKKEADGYHEQLKEMASHFDTSQDFDDMLDKYSRSYEFIEKSIGEGRVIEGGVKVIREVDSDRPKAGGGSTVIISNKEEVERLRSMMFNQHQIIAELKRKLRENEGDDDNPQLIDELSDQLEKQERFLKESETCIQLLEDELAGAQREIDALSKELKNLKMDGVLSDRSAQSDDSSSRRSDAEVEALISGYVEESRDMLNTISILEQENQQLKEQINMGDIGGSTDSAEANRIKEKLSEVQQELLNLQTQHIELEERYIELKSSMF